MIILTGGAGFIGSCFLWKLNSMGIEDILVVDELDNTEKWKNLVGKKFRDYVQKDDLLKLIEDHRLPDPKHIVHMGACSSTTLTDADHYIKTNYEYSKVLAEWALSKGGKFMYASSAATYGDGAAGYSDSDEKTPGLRPLNMYGFSKHMFDLWAMRNGMLDKITGIKFFNVFGPNEYHKGEMMSVVCKKFPEVVEEGKIKLFRSYDPDYPDGGQKRDFVYVKDAVEVMFYLFSNPGVAGIFNLGTGQARTWNDVANAMFSACGKTAHIEYIEMPEYLRPKYQYFTQADLTKLREAGCSHEFMPLEKAVEDYCSYLKDSSFL